ncbi:MAG: small ribosomal subunit biogenesis GTPase RsgA [Pseudomonadota bacterium]|nr:small ribosomal subunit biogenesis GTPase RsgA [Pseudomonadota bacterium]
MAKRHLTRRQSWRIQKIQDERAARAERRAEKAEESLEGGDLGPEQPGLVIAHFGVQVDVEATSGEFAGQIRRCYRRANLPSLVTGDQVVWRADNQQGGVIVAQQPRQTELCRPDQRGQLKPVAANVDRLIIVFAPLPTPYTNLIDRYLVAAEQAGLEPLLVMNKSDLLHDSAEAPELLQWLQDYSRLGYRTLLLSAGEGNGLDQLRGELQGHTSVFVGQSGVGKSSLINALLPGQDLRVGALSESTGKGTHTTTTARLFHFPDGGDLIDSPGIREFGLTHISHDELLEGFIEFRPLLGLCRFRDCQHLHEPGCALLQAVDSGEISTVRMASYRHILSTLDDGSDNY